MRLDRPFQVITPTLDGDVLAALARADAAFTGRGLHQLIGRYSAEGVRRALERLTGQGIVNVTVAGPSRLYSLNRAHLAAPYVVALAHLANEFLDKLRAHLGSWPLQPAYAALFGSAAGREMRTDSDIDLFVVRPDAVQPEDETWVGQLQGLAHDGSRWTGNDLNVLEMSEADAKLRSMNGDQVLADIQASGICVAGRSEYLRLLNR